MKIAHPTAIELELLKLLWVTHKLSARELHEATEDFSGWSFSSTRKTLDRMVEKGLLDVSEVHGVKVYRARVRKLSVLAMLTRDFARRVLGSSPSNAVAAFSESELLSAAEIEELRRMLSKDD